MSAQDFTEGLQKMGYVIEEAGSNKIKFDYLVSGGRFRGQKIKLGFEVPPDWPFNPPHGPHMSPRLLPLNPNASGHPDRVCESPFGQEWEQWSRPFPNWPNTNRTVKEYMRYIQHLFEIIL